MPVKVRPIEDVFPSGRTFEFVAGYESESAPGTLWYVVRDTQTNVLKCTCRGYLRSKNRECIHILATFNKVNVNS